MTDDEIFARLHAIESRLVRLEAMVVVRRGTPAAAEAADMPVTIADAEPNTPR